MLFEIVSLAAAFRDVGLVRRVFRQQRGGEAEGGPRESDAGVQGRTFKYRQRSAREGKNRSIGPRVVILQLTTMTVQS